MEIEMNFFPLVKEKQQQKPYSSVEDENMQWKRFSYSYFSTVY